MYFSFSRTTSVMCESRLVMRALRISTRVSVAGPAGWALRIRNLILFAELGSLVYFYLPTFRSYYKTTQSEMMFHPSPVKPYVEPNIFVEHQNLTAVKNRHILWVYSSGLIALRVKPMPMYCLSNAYCRLCLGT